MSETAHPLYCVRCGQPIPGETWEAWRPDLDIPKHGICPVLPPSLPVSDAHPTGPSPTGADPAGLPSFRTSLPGTWMPDD